MKNVAVRHGANNYVRIRFLKTFRTIFLNDTSGNEIHINLYVSSLSVLCFEPDSAQEFEVRGHKVVLRELRDHPSTVLQVNAVALVFFHRLVEEIIHLLVDRGHLEFELYRFERKALLILT